MAVGSEKSVPLAATGLVADPLALEHDTGWGHPECPERFTVVRRALHGLPLQIISARDATLEEIGWVHSPAYVATARDDIASGMPVLSTGDTSVCLRSWACALRAAGSALAAVDAVMTGQVANAFVIARPPGHHATRDRGMGFCVLNNVAVAACHARRRYGIDRVLIVDWDVHHGNGTQDIFYWDGTVFYFSTHQWPWYPGTGAAHECGEGAGRGTTLNCPLPAGSGREQIVGAFERQLVPAMEKFRPGLVLVSAGFDSRRGDPLGGFLLEDADFVTLTKLVLGIARAHAGGRLVSVLEGGYHLAGLAAAARAHVETLAAQE